MSLCLATRARRLAGVLVHDSSGDHDGRPLSRRLRRRRANQNAQVPQDGRQPEVGLQQRGASIAASQWRHLPPRGGGHVPHRVTGPLVRSPIIVHVHVLVLPVGDDYK